MGLSLYFRPVSPVLGLSFREAHDKGPCSVTFLIRTFIIVEWCAVRCGLQIPNIKKTCVQKTLDHVLKCDNRSRINSRHSWGIHMTI